MHTAKSHLKSFLAVFLYLSVIAGLNAQDTGGLNEEKNRAQESGGSPLLMSLFLSHGSGLYILGEPEKAKPYLASSIIFSDIPAVILAAAIIVNYAAPDIFEGDTLVFTEYLVNACVISILVSVPLLRILECIDAGKYQKE